MSRTATRDIAIDSRIGDYKVERLIESEEHSVVYLGHHVLLPRKAAIKLLHIHHVGVQAIAVRVLREACMLEAMFHPGIPRVYECGMLPDRRPWTAFEYIEGETLSTSLANEQLAIADVVVLIRDVADILHHAHERGVLHGSMTADALVRTPGRSVRVVHWGDACAFDTGARAVDARDDVYALGVVAFRSLTGSWPRRAVSTSDRCPHAPRDLAALVDRMLATDPGARPTSEEVRDRAGWIANTYEHVARAERPKWLPSYGGEIPAVPVAYEDSSGIKIRR